MMRCPSAPAAVPLRLASLATVAAVVAVMAPGSRLPAADWPCVPDERSYAVFDALFLQRDNAAVERPLVVATTAPAVPVIAAGDPVSTIGTGARVLYGTYGEHDVGWEVGYLGVYGMGADRLATDAGGRLEAPNRSFAVRTGLVDGFSARLTDDMTVQSAEFNLVFHDYDGGFNRRSGRPWQRCDGYDGGHVDWIGGFRWADVEDAAMLSIPRGSTPQASTYGVTTSSNLFAGQVGVRGRMAFERWALEGTMKIGIAGTMLSQSQTLFDPLAAPFRKPKSSDTAGMGMIAEIGPSAVYRLSDVWGLRVGYNMLWFTGVALAPDQFDFTPTAAGGTNIVGAGSVFLSGGSLGLEARW